MSDDGGSVARWRTTDIYDDLLARLTTAAIPAGARIKPADLQGEYGCSANTIRDVLLQLSQSGVVVFELQRGFRAAAATPGRRADLARFRILLEQEGAARSMAEGGIDWESRLAAAHHRLGHIESQIAAAETAMPLIGLWSDAERNFHETLIGACGSPVLIETWTRTYAQFRQQMTHYDRIAPDYFPPIIDEHRAILEAALRGDAAGLRAAIHGHLARHL